MTTVSDDSEYEIDVDESNLYARECVDDECGSITIGVLYEPQFCGGCGVNLTMHGLFDEDEGS